MLTSINPLGERARGNKWGTTATAYILGSVVAATVLGAALGSVGVGLGRVAPLSNRTVDLAALVILMMAALLELHPFGFELPTIHRQVNEDWLHRYRGWVYGAGFGLQLGVGAATIVTTSTVYATLAMEAMVGWSASGVLSGVAAAMLVGATFGLARSLPVVMVARVHGPTQLRSAHRTFIARANAAIRMSVGALAASSAVLLVGALR
jgi:hypothetical protein